MPLASDYKKYRTVCLDCRTPFNTLKEMKNISRCPKCILKRQKNDMMKKTENDIYIEQLRKMKGLK